MNSPSDLNIPEKIRKTRSAAAAANKDKASSEPKRPNNSASNDNSDNGSGSRKKAKTTQEQITGEPEVDEVTEDKKDEEDNEPEEVDESEGDDEPVEDLRSNMYPHFRPECQVFFRNIQEWDEKWKTAKKLKGIKKVTFGDDFQE